MQTFLEALSVFFAHKKSVDDHFNVVILVAVELHALRKFAQLAIYADVEKTFFANVLKKFLIVTLTIAHQGRKQIDFMTVVVVEHHVEDTFLRIFHHGFAREVGVSLSGSGVEQTQEVVDFCDGSDG